MWERRATSIDEVLCGLQRGGGLQWDVQEWILAGWLAEANFFFPGLYSSSPLTCRKQGPL